MNPKPLEIFSARIPLRNCNNMRPCVIVHPLKLGKVAVAYLSSQPDLCDNVDFFPIASNHSSFSATGLTRTSFISSEVYEIEVSELKCRLGQLNGELARAFKEWYGLP